MIARGVALLERAYAALGRVWVVALFGNLVIVFFIIFGLFGTEIPDGAPGVVELQLSFSADRFSDITAQWGPDAVGDFRARLWIDYLFPPVYAIALGGLVAWSASKRNSPPPAPILALFAAPFIAALCDLTENTAHWFALNDPANPSGVLVLIASIAAAIKWALLGIVLLVVIVRFTFMTGRYLIQQR